jgi:hypothetical protein
MKQSTAQLVAKNMGHNQTRVGQLASGQTPNPMEVEQNSGQPPPDPGAGGTPIIESAGGVKSTGGKAGKLKKFQKTTKGLRISGKITPNDLVIHMVPGPGEEPAGMAPPPHGGPPPAPGKGRSKKAKVGILKDAQAKARAQTLLALQQLKTLKAKKDENMAPKLEPSPTAEKLAPPRAASPAVSRRDAAATAAEARARSRSRDAKAEAAKAAVAKAVAAEEAAKAAAATAAAAAAAVEARARSKSRDDKAAAAAAAKPAAAKAKAGGAGPIPKAAAKPAAAKAKAGGAGPISKRPASTSVSKAEKKDRAGSKPPDSPTPEDPPLQVVVAPAPKRPTRGRSSSATPPTVPESSKSRSRSKDDNATASSSKTAPEQEDTPAPKRQGAKEPDEPFRTRGSLAYIAANMLEAVKIDGFDGADAVRAIKLEASRKGASDKENKEIDKEMKEIWERNGEAIKAFNKREAADRKSQEKDNKKQKQ